MELRGQDKEIGMPSSLGYSPPNRESPSKVSPASIVLPVGDRRRDGAASGTTVLSPSQTLDHRHLHHHQFNLQQQTQHGEVGDPDPDPDPVSATIAVSGATATPITGGSNPKVAAAPPHPPPQSAASIRYRECLKNHAASMGGHVFDGCGEFMPSGEEGTLEALKCAACDCHRNFHRKEIDGESQPTANCYYTCNPNTNSSRRNTIAPQLPPSHAPLPHLHQHHKYSHGLSGSPLMSPIPPMMMAFGGGGGAPAESSSEDLNMFQSNVGMHLQPQPAFALSKKRFRTKFSQEQKDKMQEFAEKLGWKIQKQEEQEVQQFCSDVGVKRQVFKVWMHNNKQAMKKKQLKTLATSTCIIFLLETYWDLTLSSFHITSSKSSSPERERERKEETNDKNCTYFPLCLVVMDSWELPEHWSLADGQGRMSNSSAHSAF
eukprot:XP_019075029.1 PREDICTED: zinc-finger homeodomain protein 6 isoform X3 [Vitis vinifera]